MVFLLVCSSLLVLFFILPKATCNFCPTQSCQQNELYLTNSVDLSSMEYFVRCNHNELEINLQDGIWRTVKEIDCAQRRLVLLDHDFGDKLDPETCNFFYILDTPLNHFVPPQANQFKNQVTCSFQDHQYFLTFLLEFSNLIPCRNYSAYYWNKRKDNSSEFSPAMCKVNNPHPSLEFVLSFGDAEKGLSLLSFGFSAHLNLQQQCFNVKLCSKKPMIRKRVAIFLSLGILLLISTIVCLLWMIKRRDKGTSKSQKGQSPLSQGIDIASILKIRESNLKFLLISFSSIVEATGNFSTANKLGQGGFGSVYKGQLPEGESIAVKRLDACSGQGLEEFMNEIRLIAKLQHRNLVKLLGCCVEGDEKLLVYEYMPNNSLDYHLFDPVRKEHLDWSKRISIIEGIAQGLLYLHKYSRVRIIHRDLKASNILLDPDMKPKISDFGMARIFDANTTQANTNRIVGTYGYMSPEYAMEGIFSIKSDVFSFGVLMLEIISGKRNTTFHKSGKALNLLAYAWELWNKGYWLDFVDPALGDKILKQEVSKCIIVALMCVQENAVDRPIMSEIFAMLGSESTTLPDPKKPAFFTTEHEVVPVTQNDVTLTILEGR